MGLIMSFILRNMEIQIDDRFKKDFDVDVNLVNQWKKQKLDYWDQVQPTLNHDSRQVQIFLSSPNPHACLAVCETNSEKQVQKMIVFHIKRRLGHFWLRPDICQDHEQVKVFKNLYKVATTISLFQTKLNNQELGQLALWCKKEKYEKVNSDCVDFVRAMAKEIALNENRMEQKKWEEIEFLIKGNEGFLGKLEFKGRNGLPKGQLAALVGNVPYYNRFGQATLFIFPISFLFVIWKRRAEIMNISGKAMSTVGEHFFLWIIFFAMILLLSGAFLFRKKKQN